MCSTNFTPIEWRRNSLNCWNRSPYFKVSSSNLLKPRWTIVIKSIHWVGQAFAESPLKVARPDIIVLRFFKKRIFDISRSLSSCFHQRDNDNQIWIIPQVWRDIKRCRCIIKTGWQYFSGQVLLFLRIFATNLSSSDLLYTKIERSYLKDEKIYPANLA